MEPNQEWCTQCGTPVPGSLSTHSSGRRASAIVLGAIAILVVGAATAAYAAINKKPVHHVNVIIAQAPAATTPAAPTTPAPATTPSTTPTKATTPVTPVPPASTIKPPKIPLTAATPKSTTPPATTTPTATTPKTATPKTTTPTTTNTAEQPPTTPAILLDTNSVTSYNPENYPAETFGDPSLAVDGDTSTGWTARVDPAIAPRMAVGLLIDLNTAQRLSALDLITSTPGMTVEVFGANGSAAPTAITNPAWVHLSPYQVEKKRHMLIKLGNSTKAFRFVTLWISGAPAASIGTPTAPGRVSINEVELFPAK